MAGKPSWFLHVESNAKTAYRYAREVYHAHPTRTIISFVLVAAVVGGLLIMFLPGQAATKQATAGWVGGSLALVTFFLTRDQKDKHFERQQEAERLRFDRQALDAQFTDILNRLASENVPIRANAAIRLAEMAAQRWPGAGEEKTPENYPFFPRAASQLAASLLNEAERGVKDQVVIALQRMSKFDDGESQLLALVQIDELVNANRHASDRFKVSLGEYLAIQERMGNTHPFESVSPFASFTKFSGQYSEGDGLNVTCLQDIAECPESKDAKKRCSWSLRETGDEDVVAAVGRVEVAAAHVISTRDCLATALRWLRPPTANSDDHADPEWKRPGRVSFSGCTLSGASLSGAHLQGFTFFHVSMHGVRLNQARLHRTTFLDADLKGADLHNAEFFRTAFRHARLQDAYLFRGKLRECHFRDARLSRAVLQEAELFDCKFEKADVQDALVWGAKFEQDGQRASCLATNWGFADFRKYGRETTPEGEALKTWVLERYQGS